MVLPLKLCCSLKAFIQGLLCHMLTRLSVSETVVKESTLFHASKPSTMCITLLIPTASDPIPLYHFSSRFFFNQLLSVSGSAIGSLAEVGR